MQNLADGMFRQPREMGSGTHEPRLMMNMPDRTVVLKPPGWEVCDQHTDYCLLLWLRSMEARFSEIRRDRGSSCGFIHRLDIPSSGLIIASKSYDAYMHMQLQLAAGSILRDYVMICHGWIAPSLHKIGAGVYWRVDTQTEVGGQGKASATHLTAIMYVFKNADALGLGTVRIKTGRRHQIRSHLSHVGHPVVRDGMYTALLTFERDLHMCPRNCLHRFRLEFEDERGIICDTREQLPRDLVVALESLA